MTPSQARIASTTILASAAVTAAWAILRSPRLRTQASRWTRLAITSGLPLLLTREVQSAWREAGRSRSRTPATG